MTKWLRNTDKVRIEQQGKVGSDRDICNDFMKGMGLPQPDENQQHCSKIYGLEYVCMTCSREWGCDHCHMTRTCGGCGFMSCKTKYFYNEVSDEPCTRCGKMETEEVRSVLIVLNLFVENVSTFFKGRILEYPAPFKGKRVSVGVLKITP